MAAAVIINGRFNIEKHLQKTVPVKRYSCADPVTGLAML